MVSSAVSMQSRPRQQLTRAYENKRMSHAYIFDGAPGTGKRELAYYFCQLVLCESKNQSRPCGECRSCSRILSNNHPNIFIVQRDGSQIKKEQIDQLIRQMSKKGYEKGHRFYMIEEAHMMNASAANALLKFLEEPEGEVTAILLTDAYQQLLPTIRSRCQRIPFHTPQPEQLVQMLMEEIDVTESLASTVSRLTASVEEARQYTTDEQFLERRKLALQFIEKVELSKSEAILFLQGVWQEVVLDRNTLDEMLNLILHGYRDIVTIKVGESSALCYPDAHERFEQLALSMTYVQLSQKIDWILRAKRKVHSNMNRTLLMEQLILHM